VPEGDNVWFQARLLQRALAGQRLTRCDIRVPRYATVDFTGSIVDSVQSRGKHLLIRVAGHVIHSHLKMEGTWQVYPAGPTVPGTASGSPVLGARGHPRSSGQSWRRPAHTARCILGTEHATAVGFSLGLLEVLPQDQEGAAVGHLGPDLLGPDWDADEARRRLSALPERAIGLALLDQRNLAGIGNIYRNELCFLAGVHPASEVRVVADLPRMVDQAKRLLEANKDRPGRSTTGGPARGDAALWVYRREGKPCKRCGALIRHGKLGEPVEPARLRDIYFCPHCQPIPPS
jgi:endonuclease-8